MQCVPLNPKRFRLIKTHTIRCLRIRDDLEVVLNKTQQAYSAKVDAVKAKGEKPKAIALKSEAIAEILTPWLDKMGVGVSVSVTKTVSPKNPRIPRDTEKIEISEVKIDESNIKDFYDDFPSEKLEDSIDEVVKSDIDELFEGEEDLFGSDVIISDLDSNGVDFGDDKIEDFPLFNDVDFDNLI